jgi:hypothetical protein
MYLIIILLQLASAIKSLEPVILIMVDVMEVGVLKYQLMVVEMKVLTQEFMVEQSV